MRASENANVPQSRGLQGMWRTASRNSKSGRRSHEVELYPKIPIRTWRLAQIARVMSGRINPQAVADGERKLKRTQVRKAWRGRRGNENPEIGWERGATILRGNEVGK